jgi:hypothetical protein
MKKLTAFNLYARNELGGWQPAGNEGEPREVYIASDVHALLRKIEQADDASAAAGTVLRELMAR